MKIRMLVQMSGTRNGQEWPPQGEVTELPTTEAAHLVAAGVAIEVREVEVEKAVAPEAEVTEPPAAETSEAPAEEKRGPGRPRKPRNAEGKIVRG